MEQLFASQPMEDVHSLARRLAAASQLALALNDSRERILESGEVVESYAQLRPASRLSGDAAVRCEALSHRRVYRCSCEAAHERAIGLRALKAVRG